METAAKLFILFSALCAPLYIFLKIREANSKRAEAEAELLQSAVKDEEAAEDNDGTEDGEV